MPCEGCEEKKTAKPAEPVRWVSARVWAADVEGEPFPAEIIDGCAVEDFTDLPDTILGAIGVRSDGTTDWLSGPDWYGWIPFPDGTWRLSGIQGSRGEMLRVAKRYPGSVWREGILVSDAEMKKVEAEMKAYLESVR